MLELLYNGHLTVLGEGLEAGVPVWEAVAILG